MRAVRQSMPYLDKKQSTLLFISLCLVFIGARAAVINYAGSAVPFGDEWDGEASQLLQPYIEGKLTVGKSSSAHNEHIIFFTRLTDFVYFQQTTDYWDVILQMIANAIVDAVTVVAISVALSRVLSEGWAPVAMVASVLINALPLGWENILLGFNTHFYLLLAFSFTSLSVLFRQPGMVAAMGHRGCVLDRLVSMHGLGRPNPCRSRRSPPPAARGRSKKRPARERLGDRRARCIDRHLGQHRSQRVNVGRPWKRAR